MRLIDTAIGNATVVKSDRLTGPRGSRHWVLDHLSDNRIVLYGPDSHNHIPDWIIAKIPADKKFKRMGGTTCKWSAWITN